MFIPVDGIEALRDELLARRDAYARPDIETVRRKQAGQGLG
nr:hypothetical protein [Burkholderia plantarii]